MLAAVSVLIARPSNVRTDIKAQLADPFNARKGRRTVPGMGNYRCKPELPIVLSLKGVKFYTGSDNSVIDQELRKANILAMKPLSDFVQEVQSANATWLSSGGRDRKSAECGLELLRQWAHGGALLGSFNEQGKASQRWYTTGLAIAYLALRHALPDRHDPAISAWFARLGAVCRDQSRNLHNNHLNWAAAAMAASAIASNNYELWLWAIATTRHCIAKIQPDGTLPLEMARGKRALAYHSFALAPLLLVAELGLANGIDLYTEGEAALERLASFILSNSRAPSLVVKLAGEPQEWNPAKIPWAQIGARRFPGPIGVKLAAMRPSTDAYMGGNQLLLFGQ